MATRGLLLPDSEAASLSAPWGMKWELIAIRTLGCSGREKDDVG